MKKSMHFSRSYCQLWQQWARLSCRQRTGVPLTVCRSKSSLASQLSLASQTWQHKVTVPTYCQIQSRQYCSSSEEYTDEEVEEIIPTIPITKERVNIAPKFRTQHNDPLRHTIEDEGLFYRVPVDDYEKYIEPGQWPRYRKQVQTFQESVIMVRRPALEVFDYIDNANFNYPPLKILLYGKVGSGKTMTLAHTVHRYSSAGWLTIHLPDVSKYIRHRFLSPRTTLESSFKEGMYDLTDDAVLWLKYFVQQNESHLKGIKITKEVIWSHKDKAEVGTELLDIIEYGLDLKKNASDAVGIVIREIKLQAAEKNLKVLVAVDGVNGFWKNTVEIGRKQKVHAQKVTFFRHFMKLFEPDWTNSVCVGTLCPVVDAIDEVHLQRDKVPYTPRYLLKKEGFEFMDPFIPVLVTEYSLKEARNCIDYYIDRKWIVKERGLTEEGKKELMLISNYNPLGLMNVTAGW